MTKRDRRSRAVSGALLLLSLAPMLLVADGPERRRCDGAKSVPPPKEAAAPPSKDAVFKSEIRPILAAHCAPCHEPGGRMYARLPFDDPAVLSSHEPGVKKRLKGDDLKAFESWLAMAPEKS